MHPHVALVPSSWPHWQVEAESPFSSVFALAVHQRLHSHSGCSMSLIPAMWQQWYVWRMWFGRWRQWIQKPSLCIEVFGRSNLGRADILDRRLSPPHRASASLQHVGHSLQLLDGLLDRLAQLRLKILVGESRR